MDELNETVEAPVEEKPKKKSRKAAKKKAVESKPVADPYMSLVDDFTKKTAMEIPTPDQVGGSSLGRSR